MPIAILDLGPLRWAKDHICPKLAGKGFTHVIIAYPGGRETDGSDLRFDMVKRALQHDDIRVQAAGNYAIWADAAQIIREETRCKVGFYIGTSEGMTAAHLRDECEEIIFNWQGYADFICIDTLAARPMGHTDHIAANRLASAGIAIWAEPRPIRGFPLLPVPHICLASKWQSSGESLGDDDHTDRKSIEAQRAGVILLDNVSVNAETVQAIRGTGIGYAVGPDFVPIVGGCGGPL
jgi:hypothetical protein